MKIAHLILTHGKPNQLKRLVEKLLCDGDSVYIHVDLKTPINEYELFQSYPNVYFIQHRIKVYWGSYRMIQATINACKEIIGTGIAFDYVNLLSGQDYPLKSCAYIHRFLEKNPEKAFMEFSVIENEWTEAILRLEKYHLTNYPFKGSHQLETFLNFLLPRRKLPGHLIAVGRSQWFTISLKHAQYVIDYLEKHPHIKRFFQFTWGSDEFVFQTVLYNSPYKNEMVNDNLRYIDWSEKKASPKTFTILDAETLIQSGKLFARKFNKEIDEEICNYIDTHISAFTE